MTATRYLIPVIGPEDAISSTPQWTVDLATRLEQIFDGADADASFSQGWSSYGPPFPVRAHIVSAARRVHLSGLLAATSAHTLGGSLVAAMSLPTAPSLNPASSALGVTATSAGLARWQVEPGTGGAGPLLSLMRLTTDVSVPAHGIVFLSGIAWDY